MIYFIIYIKASASTSQTVVLVIGKHRQCKVHLPRGYNHPIILSLLLDQNVSTLSWDKYLTFSREKIIKLFYLRISFCLLTCTRRHMVQGIINILS